MHFELTEVLHEESGDGGQFNVHFLGRNPELCDIVVNCDQRVSGKHCRIFCERTGDSERMDVYVENLSGNSTFLRTVANPQTLVTLDRKLSSRRRLNSGDMITLLNPQRALPEIVDKSTFTFLRAGSPVVKQSIVGGGGGIDVIVGSRNVNEFYDLHPDEELGRGQYGRVYKAIHRQSGEAWACKEINTHKAMFSASSTDSILNEVQVLKGIRHPAVIAAEDIFLQEEMLLIILPLCQGGDLFDRIVSKHPLGYPEASALSVISRVVDAVAFLHENNVIHRDLKPENILLSGESDTECLLTDFGLAKRDAKCKTFCGTPAYFAPEVLAAGHDTTAVYGKEADCWSIGVLTYVLLSGSPAFPTATLNEAVSSASFTPMEGLRWEGVSSSAKDFICKFLVVSPENRLTAAQAKHHTWLLGPRAVTQAEEIPEAPKCSDTTSNVRKRCRPLEIDTTELAAESSEPPCNLKLNLN
mmetsp:Transcript_43853/g.86455  ORF Transcript_43853/g.86455 Transcript_43853/m.86455 type:complete len:471 (+) Transcript_43853:94-1506(+)